MTTVESASRRDLHLGLAHANGLHQYEVEPGCVEHRIACGAAADKPPR